MPQLNPRSLLQLCCALLGAALRAAADPSDIPAWHPHRFVQFQTVPEYATEPNAEALPVESSRGPDTSLKQGLDAIIPDASALLPEAFLPEYKNPCWRPAGGDKLQCLPYFYVLGGMQCGVKDLFKRLSMHPDIKRSHNSQSYFYDAKTETAKHLEMLESASAAVQKDPEKGIIGDASQGYLTFTPAHAENLRPEYNRVMKACWKDCHENLKERKEQDYCVKGVNNTDSCYLKAQKAEVAAQLAMGGEMTVPKLVRAVVGSATPRFVVLLRNPTERYYSTFRHYEHYPRQYGPNEEGFLKYVEEQMHAFQGCQESFSTASCALYFESMAPELEAVFYHADQLLKGMYSVFLGYWLSSFPRDSFLVLRSEDYFKDPMASLRKVFAHLGLEEPSEAVASQMQAAAQDPAGGSKWLLEARGGLPAGVPAEARRILDEFYAPFNQQLAELLGDDSFLWKD